MDCSYLQFFVNVGILTAFLIGLPYDGKDAFLSLGSHHIAWWRVMLAFGALPAVTQVLQPCCDSHYTLTVQAACCMHVTSAAAHCQICTSLWHHIFNPVATFMLQAPSDC